MIVVDSNVLAYLYLTSEYTDAAEALLETNPNWAAPVLWRSEFCNILAGYLRRGNLTFQQAYEIQREAEDLMRGAEYEVNSLDVLELVRDSECSAYDCEFIALAMRLDTRLITMDAKLLHSFPAIAVALSLG